MIYFVWAPYTLLVQIDDRLINKEIGVESINKDFVDKRKTVNQGTFFNQQFKQTIGGGGEYVSAAISPIQKSNNFGESKNYANLYAIVCTLAEIKSLKRHIPTMGWSYLVVTTKGGISNPPLYFHDGGIQDFFSALEKFVTIQK